MHLSFHSGKKLIMARKKQTLLFDAGCRRRGILHVCWRIFAVIAVRFNDASQSVSTVLRHWTSVNLI